MCKSALTSRFATQARASWSCRSKIDFGSSSFAIYHLSMKPISRASGRSSAGGGGLSGGREAHERTRRLNALLHPREGVEHAEIVIPRCSEAEWAKDRSALWNAAEQADKRKDARRARIEIALPHELNAEQRSELTRSFAQDSADRSRDGGRFCDRCAAWGRPTFATIMRIS